MHAGRDLRALLALLRRKVPSGNVPSHTKLVLQALSSMAYHEGPTAFFDFSDPAAGLMRTSNLRFPTGRGYSFATWLRLEDLKHDPQEAGRAVFALLSRSVESTKGIVVAMKGALFCCTVLSTIVPTCRQVLSRLSLSHRPKPLHEWGWYSTLNEGHAHCCET